MHRVDPKIYLIGESTLDSRAGKKDPEKTVEDLEKARWYLDREIQRLKSK